MRLLNEKEIKYFQENQSEITSDLLELLRSQGKPGKKQALEILDTPKNERMFYMDAFGQKVSFDGNKALKKAGTIMPLFPIHIEEIERCSKDFNYFRENYIQIKTHEGITFPDIRPYQDRLIGAMLDEDNEEIVGLIGRQCVDSGTKLTMMDKDCTIKELFDNPTMGLGVPEN